MAFPVMPVLSLLVFLHFNTFLSVLTLDPQGSEVFFWDFLKGVAVHSLWNAQLLTLSFMRVTQEMITQLFYLLSLRRDTVNQHLLVPYGLFNTVSPLFPNFSELSFLLVIGHAYHAWSQCNGTKSSLSSSHPTWYHFTLNWREGRSSVKKTDIFIGLESPYSKLLSFG